MNDALKMAKEMEKVYFRCKSKDKRGKKERRMEKNNSKWLNFVLSES